MRFQPESSLGYGPILQRNEFMYGLKIRNHYYAQEDISMSCLEL